MDGVRLTEIVEKMNLKNLTPGVDITERKVHVPDVNRPALQLTGFFDHFDLNRVQIIGNVECAYLETLTRDSNDVLYEKLLAHKVPCIVFSNDLQPESEFIETAEKNDICGLLIHFNEPPHHGFFPDDLCIGICIGGCLCLHEKISRKFHIADLRWNIFLK